ncbi:MULTISPECIES: c-type cytochrome [Neobacillus]|uniref:C-type cytochrome n=1 Tax=Neobacillus citreus TaxID=2833578 RepID=A0A942T4C9_9BACI|nr:c-type cytochrome [Neobacillus citreus]MCH6266661.1 c-type cytochrome [Neobacillus citreus]
MKKILIGTYILITIGIVFCIANSGIFSSENSKAIAAGEKVYAKNCLACHGETGKGEGAKDGTAINNQHFLSSVSDQDLYNYVKYGREGTSMPSYETRLSDKDLKNLVAFMREWQTEELDLKASATVLGDPERGKEQYKLYCLSCHGENGAGKIKMGTALSSPQYLKYTSDKQIWIGTAYGREETRMGPSLKGLEGARQLTEQDISDITAYIRSLEPK